MSSPLQTALRRPKLSSGLLQAQRTHVGHLLPVAYGRFRVGQVQLADDQRRQQMKSLIRRRTLWLSLNVLGMVVYLKLASALWVRPSEEGTTGGPGDAFYWLLILIPILAGFFILNSIALAAIVRRLRVIGQRVALTLWLAVATLWIGAVVVDHLHSVRYIDAQYG